MLKKFNIADWYDLKGQVAIVTGGATGLGLAITRCLISAGAVGQNRRGTRNRGYFGEQCGKPL